jgi:hypothetical protein
MSKINVHMNADFAVAIPKPKDEDEFLQTEHLNFVHIIVVIDGEPYTADIENVTITELTHPTVPDNTIKVVRFWEETPDGDASAEGVLEENFAEYEAGGGPEYMGDVVDRVGKKTYVTIN